MNLARTEIMKNRFSAMAEEAATLAFRTAHTTFMKQTQDFLVALGRTSGEIFAVPMFSGVPVPGGTIGGLTKHFSEFEPGDVVISNDPFSTDGVVTHQMDIHLVHPVFYGGELIAFAWSMVHASDIGGAVPSSISPELHECFQEGFRIRPTKLMSGGRLNQDVMNFVKDNSRIGDQVWGDLEALMAALSLLEQRAGALCERVGIAAFRQGIDDVMDYSEAKARSVIAGLRDGEYEFSDYLEGISANDPIHIHCRLRIAGDEAEIDFAGSDPQANAALNFRTGEGTHQLLCLGLTNYIQTMVASIPLNAGMLRPIRAHAPSGTAMNAEFPAAMGNRWITVMRCYDAVVGCLNQAIPGGITASGAGQSGCIAVSWQDPVSGRTGVSVVEPLSGGSGGRVRADGVDATDTMQGFLKSTPIEHVESETPLLVRQYALVPSSFGHGRYRGGASVCIELECQSVQAEIAVRGLERLRFQPWGVQGGHPGRSGETWLLRAGRETALGQVGLQTMQRGDVIRMASPSGGGFGVPVTRPVALVMEDVTNGMLDEAEAAEIYGVVIRDGVLDVPATEQHRAEMAAAQGTVPLVTHGQARREHEAKWSTQASVAFATALLDVPSGLRTTLQREARAALTATQRRVNAALVNDAVAALVQRMQAEWLSRGFLEQSWDGWPTK
ncbi:hydantoinase B/oxoprolinase family protein [Bradyrhizobium sp. BWA-3-5]|uniref:hydantoinase B/oxoprolinase family protein n=1 Tax=Bradyrhizobium sp. BWA-3-5 TaxID=3080013 RepID=UPI00293F403F|nr:hydantoinase B/oxoprolinase family protein [Bradyrhizobium sp. BWA-3-5]WOH63892.1 hydantoinase B/oxoprolinase family protein [Bradyrhizobium sp. BWA-3-5]